MLFKECIFPITDEFGIPRDHIFANTFILNSNDEVVGVDMKNPLAYDNGKVKILQSLNLQGEIYVIGDGYTDYLMRKDKLAHKFFAFCENVRRESVIKKANYVVEDFDEFLRIINVEKN